MESERRPIKYLLAALVTVLALVLVVGAASRKFRRQNTPSPSQNVPIVINRTIAIKVTDISVTPRGIVEVTLLNQSAKLITFYTFAIGEGHIMPIGGIDPGSTTVQKFSSSQFASSNELTILALSFGGGGGEGDSEEAFNLEETTEGMKEQIQAFLPTLERAANSPVTESEDTFRTFETEASEASVGRKLTSVSPGRKFGRDLAQLVISQDVQALRDRKRLDPNKTYKNGLSERLTYYKKRLSEL